MTFTPALFLNDLKIAFRSLARTKGLAFTVVLTLALGIGANAAIFTLVRGVLLRPLVNRDEDRLIYIRQSAKGMGSENTAFSVPEIQDLRASVKTLNAFGDFSTIGFTMIGLGEPREVQAGVVGGTYFEVMGLHPVLGRLIGPQDDGPNAAGAVVLTYRFWTTVLKSDPSVLGKTLRLGSIGDRFATIIGVLEPSVPYPQETEIIANVVTSPHHLSATMVAGRVHRMTELFARLAPGATLDQARAELRSVYGAMTKQHPEAYSPKADFQIGAKLLRDQITSGARTILLVLLAASGLVFIIACSNVANLILTRTVLGERLPGNQRGERQRTDHRQHQPPPAGLRGDADRGILRPAGRRECVDHYADRAANGADRSRHAPRPRHQRSRYVLRQDASASRRFLQGNDPPH